MNIIKGLDRIALVIAVIVILPGLILGYELTQDALKAVTPEYKEWEKKFAEASHSKLGRPFPSPSEKTPTMYQYPPIWQCIIGGFLICFPPSKLDPEVLNQVVAGALNKITEAGAVLAGGHTVDDDEPKFGLAVTGVVHPEKYWPNSGAKPGDVLILTKPIDSGVIFNANIKGWVSQTAMEECLEILTTLNKTAAEVMQKFEIHGATDITGFGLAGHGFEMAKGSNVCLEIDMDAIPIMREALEMYQKGMSTGVNLHNRDLVAKHMRFDKELPVWHQEIVFDPQTSGGLLVSLPENQATDLVHALIEANVYHAAIIGKVVSCKDSLLLLFK